MVAEKFCGLAEPTNLKIPESFLESDELSTSEKGFLQRVYADGLNHYERRLARLGFQGKDEVLDSGCGFGQWSFALAKTCRHVTAIDISPARIKTCKQLAEMNLVQNVTFLEGKLENLPFSAPQFEAIFCYSALYLTDHLQVLQEFYRVLKSNGSLYLSTNGLGKYLHDIIYNPNSTVDFSPRVFSLKTLLNSLLGTRTGLSPKKGGIVMSQRGIMSHLRLIGFVDVKSGGDGMLSGNAGVDETPLSFYNERFLGFENVFEVLARKP